jgi:hypothetical protein
LAHSSQGHFQEKAISSIASTRTSAAPGNSRRTRSQRSLRTNAITLYVQPCAGRPSNEYRERALAMIEQKVKGQEIRAVALARRRTGQVVDIFAALKKSQAQKEGVGTENQRLSFLFSVDDCPSLSIQLARKQAHSLSVGLKLARWPCRYYYPANL